MVGVLYYAVLVVSIMNSGLTGWPTVLHLSFVSFDPVINQLVWTGYFQHNSHYPLMTTNECLTQTGPVFIGRGTRCSHTNCSSEIYIFSLSFIFSWPQSCMFSTLSRYLTSSLWLFHITTHIVRQSDEDFIFRNMSFYDKLSIGRCCVHFFSHVHF